ncbi:MAG TPA: asparaginase [Bacillota bacterium]|nr:asparaginase [Bacillota bacterium]
MKKILIIHTGGTISMLENKETKEVNFFGKSHPLLNELNKLDINAKIDEHIQFDLPSPHITPQHMFLLSQKVSAELPFYDGIVITHGTDTLEETAYFLHLTVKTDKPIIITGAMRSSNEIGSDALYNLICSVRVAMDQKAANKGVLVVMNDEIHSAENVTKTSTSNIATFQSPQFGPLGIITKNAIFFHRTILQQPIFPVNSISKHVILLKAYAGMDCRLLAAVQEIKPDGIVIEGFGQGNLPESVVPALQAFIRASIPVILVSRSFTGTVQPTYSYAGGGKQLKEMGVIFAQGMTGQKARIKLLIALEHTTNLHELESIFESFA